MKKETKWLGAILIITVVLLFGGIFLLTRKDSSKAVAGATVSQIDYSKGQKIGSSSAKIKLVEFSDFQCPACAVAGSYTKKLRVTYSDQIQFIYRHFPLPQHIHARSAAILAEAAGEQGKFWEMHDRLFETQEQWSKLASSTAFFMDLAKQLGLDEVKVEQALKESAFKSEIDSDIAEGQSLGVNFTPTFFINGRKLTLRTFEDLNTAVAEELKK